MAEVCAISQIQRTFVCIETLVSEKVLGILRAIQFSRFLDVGGICLAQSHGHIYDRLEDPFSFNHLFLGDHFLAATDIQAGSTLQSGPDSHVEILVPVVSRPSAVPVGNVLNNAFGRPLPMIKHNCQYTNLLKYQLHPRHMLQCPSIYPQFFMPYLNAHNPNFSPS